MAAAFADGHDANAGAARTAREGIRSPRGRRGRSGATAGVAIEIEGDDLIVHGLAAGCAGGGTVATHLDHRIAMAFLVMGLATQRADDGR